MSQEIVARIRANYPTPLAGAHPAFLLEVAQTLGGGLLKKDTGTNILLPSGVRVAQDIFCRPPVNGICTCFDILRDGEGSANPVFNRSDDQPESRYYAVGTQPQPEPEPQPDPQLAARIAALEARCDVFASAFAAQALENKRLDAAIRDEQRANTAQSEHLERHDGEIAVLKGVKMPTAAIVSRRPRITLPLE